MQLGQQLLQHLGIQGVFELPAFACQLGVKMGEAGDFKRGAETEFRADRSKRAKNFRQPRLEFCRCRAVLARDRTGFRHKGRAEGGTLGG